jgi:hypothetical protein
MAGKKRKPKEKEKNYEALFENSLDSRARNRKKKNLVPVGTR